MNKISIKLVEWIKNKLGITVINEEIHQLKIENVEFNSILNHKSKYISSILRDIKKYTTVDADAGIRGNNTIILTGVYRKRAYVQFYDIGDGEFNKLVDMLKSMDKTALIRHIDSVPDFRGSFDL